MEDTMNATTPKDKRNLASERMKRLRNTLHQVHGSVTTTSISDNYVDSVPSTPSSVDEPKSGILNLIERLRRIRSRVHVDKNNFTSFGQHEESSNAQNYQNTEMNWDDKPFEFY